MPNNQFAYRTAKTIGLTQGPPEFGPLADFDKPEGNLRCTAYSLDGSLFAWASPEEVRVVDASTGNLRHTIALPNVHELVFSPKGSYLNTWERPWKNEEDGSAGKNLKIWSMASGEQIIEFVQKSQNGWSLQYSQDEKICCRNVTNEVHIYESANIQSGIWKKLRVEGLTSFSLSPGANPSIAVFLPERKGSPASTQLFSLANLDRPSTQKQFYKADKIAFLWNSNGRALLAHTTTDVDKTNKSYYGESNLYLLNLNTNQGVRVDLDKEGPVHDVSWGSESEFGVVYGYMPAKTTLFDVRANPIQTISTGPRNTIKFSPGARFVLVAGFGNLQGTMDVFQRKAKNWDKLATMEASNSSVCEWSPDETFILTGTTSPRLRVDNGVRVWWVGGKLVYKEEMNELYQVIWRPFPISTIKANPLAEPQIHSSALAQADATGGASTPTKPAGAYRPPHARGTLTPAAFKREDEGGVPHTNGFNNGIPVRDRVVPGLAPAEAKDEKKTRSRRKKEKAAAAGEPVDVAVAATAAPASPAPVTPTPVAETPDISADDLKKIRALTKKLRAIEELKLRQAGGEKLEKTQEQKIEKEGEIVDELQKLGFTG